MINAWINFKAITEYREVIASAGYKDTFTYFKARYYETERQI